MNPVINMILQKRYSIFQMLICIQQFGDWCWKFGIANRKKIGKRKLNIIRGENRRKPYTGKNLLRQSDVRVLDNKRLKERLEMGYWDNQEKRCERCVKEDRNRHFLFFTLSHTNFINDILVGRLFSFTARTLPAKTYLSWGLQMPEQC